MSQKMLNKKVIQFILLTFLISWSVALIAYLLHVTYGSILNLVILAVFLYACAGLRYCDLTKAGLQKHIVAIRLYAQEFIATLAFDNDHRVYIVHRPGNLWGHCHIGKRIRTNSLWQN